MGKQDYLYTPIAGAIVPRGGIVLSVTNPARAAGLAKFTAQLAQSTQQPIHLVSIVRPQENGGSNDAAARWPALDTARTALQEAGLAAEWVVCEANDIGRAIRQIADKIKASVIVLGWHGKPRADGVITNAVLKNLLQDPTADVMVVGGGPIHNSSRILVPYTDGPHSELALRLSFDLTGKHAAKTDDAPSVTAFHVLPDGADKPTADVRDTLRGALKDRPTAADRLHTREVTNNSPAQAIIAEAKQGYDMIVIGTSSEEVFDDVLFGTLPRKIADGCDLPVIVVRHHTDAIPRALKGSWRALFTALPTLNKKEQAEVSSSIRAGAMLGPDFITMISLSTVIAALGLLLNSPAVIIGAMLVAPLMSPIIALALASVYGDRGLLGTAARTAAIGIVLSIVLGWLIGLLVPNAQATPEVLARTAPNVLDLFVALAAGAAGAYALCRRKVASSLAGVAIAVALVPPLASVGILLSLLEFSLSAGAALLFATNLIAIVAAGTLIFLLLGFVPSETQKERRRIFRRSLWGALSLLVMITLVLGFLTVQTIRETRFNQTLRTAVATRLGERFDADLVEARFTTDIDGALLIAATVRTPDIIPQDDIIQLQTDLAQRLERPVGLELTILPVTKLPPPETEP